jgi:hypothetical protein
MSNNFVKKNKKLIKSVFLIGLLSIINTVEGVIYCVKGLSIEFVSMEVISLFITLILLHDVWCVFDEGKCTTVKKT